LTRDPLDDLGASEFEAQQSGAQPAGLSQLFSDLTSPPVDSELAGQQSVLSMFRTVRAEQAGAQQASGTAGAAAAQTRVLGSATGKPPRRPSPRMTRPAAPAKKARIGARLVAAAMFLAIAGGFAAAGYAAALPAPLQRVAYQILGFAGVPDARQPHLTNTPPASTHTVNRHSPATSPSPSGPSPASPRPSHHRSPTPKPKSPSHSHSPTPHPSSPGHPTGPVQIAIAATQPEITAGQSVQVTASLTRGGQPGAGIKISLLEKEIGHPGHSGGGPGAPAGRGWQIVQTTATDARGQVTFTVSDLTTNALFRVTGPHGAASSRLAVVVVPPVTASLESGPRPKLDLLVASSPLAESGDKVELEAYVRGLWRVVRLHRLHADGQAAFNIPLRKIAVTYRVVLPATRAHGESTSNQVIAPARVKHAQKLPG
jgi:hypothetical protein